MGQLVTRVLVPLTAACVFVGAAASIGGVGQVGQTPDPVHAERAFKMGLAFLEQGSRDQAKTEFQRIIDSFRDTPVWDAAVLKQSELFFDEGRLAEAKTQVEKLTNSPITRPATPMARVLLGRIYLAARRAPRNARDPVTGLVVQSNAKRPDYLSEAVSTFQRVRQYHPGNDATGVAKYYEAEARRLSRAFESALAGYREVSSSYPRSAWAAKALLGEARCLVRLGRGASAMEPLQRIRDGFPGTPEALTALRWNTILYRLFLKSGSAFTYTGRGIPPAPAQVRDVENLLVDASGTLFAASQTVLARFDAATGSSRQGPGVAGARALVRNPTAEVIVVHRNGLSELGGKLRTFTVEKPGGTPRPLDDLRAAVLTSLHESLLVDGGVDSILRFTMDGSDDGVFAPIAAKRLAIDSEDRVAALDSDNDVVELLLPDGKPGGRITRAGGGFQNLVDLAFDDIGFLYLLDRGAGAVLVFDTSEKLGLRAKFVIAEKSPGAFRRATALGVDPAGRLFIYDESARRIQCYQ